MPFLSTVAFFYAFVCLVTFLLNLKKIPKEAEPAVFSFLFAYLIALITQIFLPKLHVQNLCIGFSTLIGLLTIQDFKSYTDYETQLYNKSGFLIQYDLFFKQKSCVLFLINIEAVNFIYSIFGTEVYLALEKQIVTKIFGKPRSDRFGAKISRGKFILALSNTNKIQKEQDALLDTFSNPFIFKDRVFTISAHICKVLIPEDTEDIQNIFQAQNELTRQKKQYAVNTIIPFNQLKITKSARYFEISKKINDALLADGFDVVFQPIVSPTSQKTISAEALVRFHTTNGKFISPAEFIPIAEQTGKIHEIGEIVIHKSCQFMQKLKKEQTDIRFIEINLSPVQCLHPNLSQKILSIVKKYELEPKDICFEITETTTNRTPAVIKTNLNTLVSAGFLIAIDDFGTGYSNIAQLMELPFSIVKFDRSLIEKSNESKNVKIGTQALITMFKQTKMKLIAEGVETAEQVKHALSMGIDYIQGYYFSKPLNSEAFQNYLKTKEA